MSSGPRAAGVATNRRVPGLLSGLVTALVAMLLLPAAAAAIDEFPLPPGGAYPGGITVGPDGNLWFTSEGTGDIGRMTPGGAVTVFEVTGPAPGVPTDVGFVPPVDQITSAGGFLWFTMPYENRIGRISPAGGAATTFDVPFPDARPEGITTGSDGNVWFTAANARRIGRITLGGAITLYGETGSGPSDITSGSDGRVWFTEAVDNRIGAIRTDAAPAPGTAIAYNLQPLTGGADPSGITPGPGGALWFTETAVNQIGQISTTGFVTEYPGTLAGPSGIAVGADGALWFTESLANTVGRITSAGAITNHFPLATPASEPSDIVASSDGSLWFTQFTGHKIGRVATAPPAPPVIVPPQPPAKKKKKCKVPKLKGLTVKKAIKKLKRAKCKYKMKGKGRVTKTKPKAGKRTSKRVQVTAKPKRRRSR